MSASLTKPEIVRAVSALPEDATVEDAMERLLMLSRVAEGLEQVRRGDGIPHAEVARRMQQRMIGWRRGA